MADVPNFYVVKNEMNCCIDSLIQYNGKTSGRDKLYRLVQYASKLAADILKNKGSDQDTIDKVDSLINVMGMARVTYRLGTFLDLIQAALKISKKSDPIGLRSIIVLARLCTAGFLYYDMLAWPIKAKIAQGDVSAISLKSTTFWFWAAIFNLARDLYECFLQLKNNDNSEDSTQTALTSYRKLGIFLDSLRNVCDMFIAGEACKKIPVSQTVVGFCGVVSSIIYMLEIIYPAMKL